ncbi:MAG TPA: hypothetical protein VIM65_20800, partial [Cyclobacteriaceae bacterium]
MKIHIAAFLTISTFISSCRDKETPSDKIYETRDYLMVTKYLDTINASLQKQFDSSGTYSMPYNDLSHGKKRLIFFGTNHVRDVTHPQFNQLAKLFREMKPEISFNEGGQIPFDRFYPDMDSAIHAGGETGCLKFLSDQANIKMMNGDMEDKEEFAELLKSFPKDQVYLYMAVERFLNPYKQGRFPGITLQEAFDVKFINYLDKSDFPLTQEEKTFTYLEEIYKHYLGADLKLENLIQIQEYYLGDSSVFGNVGRATKDVRDQALLKKIDDALNK